MLDLDRSWTRPAPTAAQWRFDLIGGVALAVLSVASVEVWRSASGTDLGWQSIEGYLWFALAGLALAGRRRFPLSTLVVESAIFIAIGERLEGLSGVFTLQMILFASLYAAWAWSRNTRTLLAVSAVVLVAMFGWLIYSIIDQTPATPRASVGVLSTAAGVFLYSITINIVYFFGAMAWGHVAWRSARQSEEIAGQAERERVSQERERDRAVQAERVRIARDLHDVVAHHVSGIGVQAAGANRVMGSRPEVARQALTTIERSSRQAVTQMHQLVGLLRADDESRADREPRPDLEALATLACDDTRPAVTFTVVGEPFDVAGTIGLSLFRVAQEAVANSRRHAMAGTVAIVLRYLPDALEGARAVEVEVVDDGRNATSTEAAATATGGFGLTGIRERMAMLDGSVDIGPRPQGGFRVRVRVPVTDA